MQLPTPISISDVEYPLACVSLATAAMPTADGGVTIALSLRIVPARLVEGEIERREDHGKSVLLNGEALSEAMLTDTKAFLQSLL